MCISLYNVGFYKSQVSLPTVAVRYPSSNLLQLLQCYSSESPSPLSYAGAGK